MHWNLSLQFFQHQQIFPGALSLSYYNPDSCNETIYFLKCSEILQWCFLSVADLLASVQHPNRTPSLTAGFAKPRMQKVFG